MSDLTFNDYLALNDLLKLALEARIDTFHGGPTVWARVRERLARKIAFAEHVYEHPDIGQIYADEFELSVEMRASEIRVEADDAQQELHKEGDVS